MRLISWIKSYTSVFEALPFDIRIAKGWLLLVRLVDDQVLHVRLFELDLLYDDHWFRNRNYLLDWGGCCCLLLRQYRAHVIAAISLLSFRWNGLFRCAWRGGKYFNLRLLLSYRS